MNFRLRVIWLSLFALMSLGLATFFQGQQERHALRFAQLADRAQQQLQIQTAALEATLDSLRPLLDSTWLNDRALAARLNSAKAPAGSAFYIFEGTSLKYWSDNSSWPDTNLLFSIVPSTVNFLGNGWYMVQKRSNSRRILIGTIVVQYQYMLQNKYLVNNFNESLGLSDDAKLLKKPAAGTWAVTDINNNYLFSLKFSSLTETITDSRLVTWLYFLGIILLILIALDLMLHSARKKSIWGPVIILLLAGIRFLMIEFQFPKPIYESELFSPKYYASSYLLNSLGDLLLTVSLFALIIVYLYIFFSSTKLNRQNKYHYSTWSGVVVFVFLATFLFSVLINYLLSGLIINSQISFNINNVFELTGYSLIGMLVIAILLVSLYLMCDGIVQFIRKTGFAFAHISILFLISQGIFLALLLTLRETELFVDYGVSAFALANILILFISYIRGTERRLFSFSRTVLVILAFSIYAAQIIYSFNLTKEHEKRQLISARLENEQDLVAEYLFEDIETRIQSDRSLQAFFRLPLQSVMTNPTLLDDFNRRLIRQYFSGYLGRYETEFKYFSADGIPINRAGDPTWNLDEIEKDIQQEGKPTFSDYFFYKQDATGKIRYISKIDILEQGKKTGVLIATLTARYGQEDSGFPDLLLSSKVGTQRDLSNYSYARYLSGKLVNQSGNYNYYLTDAPYEEYFVRLQGMRFVTFDKFSHLFYRYGDKGLIIVSSPVQGLGVFITLFSYIFTCFSLTFLILYLTVRWVQTNFKLQVNFKSRIQLTVVAIVAATLVLIGVATVTYIVNNYEQAQSKRIREKLNNVLLLVESELGSRSSLGDKLSDDLVYAFSQLSSTLSVDFNIYGMNGVAQFSSQPKIYEQQLMAPLMNREAFSKLSSNQKALFIQSEKIGRLSYTAAYEPIRNSENITIGYLSLPYFAREIELKRDISSFLVALINIYVLLFSIAVLLAFFISNRITQPLRIIQESLKRTKLGKANEPIRWKQKDEIGALINEYNRMVAELQRSAELLARSERESAWREMAKQVAHEIKNPLTPMKLGVQHLQRAWMNDHPDKDRMVEKLCVTLVEQIDTLSNIANEFSNFAKMPGPEFTKVDLSLVLQHTVDLYSETEQVQIQFANSGLQLAVQADKEQLLRIFSNLVKNAIQAIPDNREGRIEVIVKVIEDAYIVEVRDNGLGIPDQQIDKIFVPNFTTKTGGTGLGLAMVKNMTEGMGGGVWFKTTANEGTSFFVKLLKV